MPGGGGISLRQIILLLLVAAVTVFLVRQVTWHALLAATGGIMLVAAFGIYIFYRARKGYEQPSEAFDDGRGTGLWWWLWAYGTVVLQGIGIGLVIVGTA